MAGRLEIFYDLVKNKAELDLKNQPDWRSKQFIYNGEIIDNDGPGNIMYVYMGKVFFKFRRRNANRNSKC